MFDPRELKNRTTGPSRRAAAFGVVVGQLGAEPAAFVARVELGGQIAEGCFDPRQELPGARGGRNRDNPSEWRVSDKR